MREKKITGVSQEVVDQSKEFLARLKSGERAESVLGDAAVFFHNLGIDDGVNTLFELIESKRDIRGDVKREIEG